MGILLDAIWVSVGDSVRSYCRGQQTVRNGRAMNAKHDFALCCPRIVATLVEGACLSDRGSG